MSPSNATIETNNCLIFRVIKKSATVYNGPGTRYGMAQMVLHQDDRVIQLRKLTPWIQAYVPSKKTTTWIHQGFLSFEPENNTQPMRSSIAVSYFSNARIKTAFANIRSGNSTKTKILFTLNRDSVVKKLFTKHDWVKIWVPYYNRIGWIFRELLNE